jgi:NADPH-dependent 2,4-dienoyl-CoA reductase/sulfur reductase-like enzyme
MQPQGYEDEGSTGGKLLGKSSESREAKKAAKRAAKEAAAKRRLVGRVIVVGGGPAGLAAATVLQVRGPCPSSRLAGAMEGSTALLEL